MSVAIVALTVTIVMANVEVHAKYARFWVHHTSTYWCLKNTFDAYSYTYNCNLTLDTSATLYMWLSDEAHYNPIVLGL